MAFQQSHAQTLAGKVALVTGASRGIGRACALELAARGATVVVNYNSAGSAAAAVVRAIEDGGGSAVAVAADISQSTAVRHLFDETLRCCGRLDIFVANAGYAAFAPLSELDEAEFDRMFAVNAKGTFLCLQQAARHVADGGRIICVSTIGTMLNLPQGAAYFGSKGAVEQFARVLAKELAPRLVTVNCVSPGFTNTDMLVATGCNDPAVSEEIIAMTPLARLGEAADIAAAVCFLAAPEGGWINRQNLAADGGIVSR